MEMETKEVLDGLRESSREIQDLIYKIKSGEMTNKTRGELLELYALKEHTQDLICDAEFKLDKEKLELIQDISKKNYTWLELGLQSSHNKTLEHICSTAKHAQCKCST